MNTKMKRIVLFVFLSFFLASPLPAWAEDTVLSLKERIIDIQNKGDLGFRNFTLCKNIITYGQYIPYPDNKVKTGSTVFFYYEPENVYTDRRNGIYHVWYTQSIIVRDADGKELLKSEEILNFNHQAIAPVLDLYAKNSLNLGKVSPGTYQFEAILHDKLRDAEARTTYTFEVVP